MYERGRGSWGCFFLALAASSPQVIAAEYYIEPSASAGYEFDNNRGLRDPARSASTWRFSPLVKFGVLTPSSEVTGAARVDVNESNREEVDSTDIYAGLFPVYRTERSEWSMDATYRRDTTLRTNLFNRQDFGASAEAVPNPNDEQPNDSNLGLTPDEVRRNVVLLSPAWQRQLSPRFDLGLRYTYIDRFYSNTGTSNLVDNRRHLGRAELSYNLSELDDVSVFAAYQNFKNDQNSKFDTYRAGLGLKHRFSETLTALLDVSPEFTDRPTGQKDDLGYAVGFGVNKKFETSNLAFVFHRGVSPSENGDALERNQVDVRWLGDLSERWSFAFLARAFRNERVANVGSTSNDRYYAQVEPRISYRITEALSCELGYRFRWEDENSSGGGSASRGGGSAFSHAGLFNIRYAFDRLGVSR